MNDLRTLPGAWCRIPGGKADYSLFRRKFHLGAPARLRLLVSADSRCNLYLDGEFLCRGPVRGDLEHYHYECREVELAAGDHLLAAEVLHWSDGFLAPWSEVHYDAAFLLLGECGGELLSTGGAWRCYADSRRRLRPRKEAWSYSGNVPIAPMEEYSGGTVLEDWNTLSFDDSGWSSPEKVAFPCFAGSCRVDPPSR